jgi:hypothetical protein
VKVEKTFLILRPEANLTQNNCRPMAAFGRPFLFEVIFMYSNLLENLRLVGLALVATIVIQIIFKAVLL